jgi:hypothetical protein
VGEDANLHHDLLCIANPLTHTTANRYCSSERAGSESWTVSGSWNAEAAAEKLSLVRSVGAPGGGRV